MSGWNARDFNAWLKWWTLDFNRLQNLDVSFILMVIKLYTLQNSPRMSRHKPPTKFIFTSLSVLNVPRRKLDLGQFAQRYLYLLLRWQFCFTFYAHTPRWLICHRRVVPSKWHLTPLHLNSPRKGNSESDLAKCLTAPHKRWLLYCST